MRKVKLYIYHYNLCSSYFITNINLFFNFSKLYAIVRVDMTSIPVIPTAFKNRLIVAAIDFGTTYSGYAFSIRTEYEENPLKIVANQWKEGNGRTVSLKTPTCVLFDPNQQFHSFGFAAEESYH